MIWRRCTYELALQALGSPSHADERQHIARCRGPTRSARTDALRQDSPPWRHVHLTAAFPTHIILVDATNHTWRGKETEIPGNNLETTRHRSVHATSRQEGRIKRPPPHPDSRAPAAIKPLAHDSWCQAATAQDLSTADDGSSRISPGEAGLRARLPQDARISARSHGPRRRAPWPPCPAPPW